MISLAGAAGLAAHAAPKVPPPTSRPVTIADFYGQPWWMIVLKVVVVFLFLMVMTLFAIWAERRVIGRMQDGEPFLAGTARPAEALMSAATTAEAGAADGDRVTVTTAQGAITLPVRVRDMPDRVVWLPAHAPGCEVRNELGAGNGTLVTLRSPQ